MTFKNKLNYFLMTDLDFSPASHRTQFISSSMEAFFICHGFWGEKEKIIYAYLM